MNLAIRMTRESVGAYRAWCPALPGCAVCGQSAAETRLKIREAVGVYVANIEVALPRELGRLLNTP
jgi:predicted RNase H-like HicB family nuclease